MGKLLQMSGIIIDLIYQVDAVPESGQEARVSEFTMLPGGGFNAMVAAARSGISATYGGSIGTGPFSDIALKELNLLNIDTAQSRLPGIDQGCCTVLVDARGERTFIAKDGAEGIITQSALNQLDPGQFDWILLSGYPLVYRSSRDALAQWLESLPKTVTLVFDPCPLLEEIPSPILQTVLQRADWISANSQEAKWLADTGEKAVAASLLMHGRRGAIVRDGANGCFVATNATGVEHISGYIVDVVDTNGAGDTHIGTFVAALDRSETASRAARLANAAAAVSITRRGPATAPTLEELNQFLANPELQSRPAGKSVATPSGQTD